MMYIQILLLFCLIPSAWSANCDQYKKLVDKNVAPSADKTCQSYEYYYGLNGKKGYEEALKCAYRELQSGEEQIFGGASVLMMIYANGRGARKDIDLAMKYTCLFGGTPAEVEGRLKELEHLRMGPQIFDVCDDVTGGVMEGHCAFLTSLQDREVKNKRLEQIQSTFGVDSQASYKKLKDAFDKFQKSRVENEVDLSGSTRARMILEEEVRLQRDFFTWVEKFEQNGRAIMIDENEKFLQSLLQNLLSRAPVGTIKPEGIRLTQKVWERYRDAWLEFARVRYPKVSRDSLSKELTEERIQQLNELK